MIHFENVSKRFPGGHYGLSDISLQIETGAMAFVTGHSGAGKSTLLKLIALLERPTRGQLLIDGRNIGRLPEKAIPAHRRQVGLIFQDHRLLNDRSVFDNVALPLHVAGVSVREVGKRVRAALDCTVVFGGIHATLDPQGVLSWPGVDGVGLGELDGGPLVRYVDRLAAGEHGVRRNRDDREPVPVEHLQH